MLSSESVSLCPFTCTNKHKMAVIKNQCNLGTRMIKFENAGLRAPRKISLGAGLHSQKGIMAPVSKMIGLRAPQQKFQGSRAPGSPPLGPCTFSSPEAALLLVSKNRDLWPGLPWSQRFFSPLGGSLAALPCGEISRKTSGTRVRQVQRRSGFEWL